MNKTTATTVDEYIAQFPGEIQAKLNLLKSIILEIVPEATTAIKYDMAAFVYRGNMLYFGVFKNHIGVYPVVQGSAQFNEQLAPYRNGKSSLNFPHEKPLPVDLLKELVGNRAIEMEKKPLSKGK